MEYSNFKELLEDIAIEDGTNGEDSIRWDYSGRFMYGDECVGLVTDYPDSVIEQAEAYGIKGARKDSMGLSAIVYWPNINKENITMVRFHWKT